MQAPRLDALRRLVCGAAISLGLILAPPHSGMAQDSQFAAARTNATHFERSVAAARRLLHAWLAHADTRTLLLPDRPIADRSQLTYTPHNSGADLYPYLILTAQLTDPDLYHGRMMEMLRHEVQHTTVQRSIPADLNLATRSSGPASFFGAGEYAKDGLIAVTEYLGRTPWFYRMVDMIADAMTDAPVAHDSARCRPLTPRPTGTTCRRWSASPP